MVAVDRKRLCLYCGEPTKRGKKGEHIIPEAIGGALTLNDLTDRVVCSNCNSGILSQLDRELCSRSYLSVIASREIGAHLWQAWEVDHASNNLLVEAKPAWASDESFNSLVCYPQITFERSGPEVRGDFDEFQHFGQEDATNVLFRAARRCFLRYRSGEKGALHFERVRSELVGTGYRLAPRVFAPCPIGKVARNIQRQSFILRFITDEDRRFSLNSLEKLDDRCRVKNWTRTLGSYRPSICFFFDIGMTMRALMKLGLNLIAAHCQNTPVDHQSFAGPISIIRDEAGQIPPQVLKANGFVHADDVQTIKAKENEHSFRLWHMHGTWHVLSCFFGGQIGAYVRVPGPNHERWQFADIVAPLKSKQWSITTSSIVPFMRPRVEWKDASVVVPSFELQSNRSSMCVEVARMNPPNHRSQNG